MTPNSSAPIPRQDQTLFMCSSVPSPKDETKRHRAAKGEEYIDVKSERLSRKSGIRKRSGIFLPLDSSSLEGEVMILPARMSTDFDLLEEENGTLLCDINGADIKEFSNIEALPYAFETTRDIFDWACGLLSESPSGFALLKEAQKEGWRIRLTDLPEGGFHLDAQDSILELDHAGFSPAAIGRSAYFRCCVLMSFMKGLRDIWHENRLGEAEYEYTPDAFLALERARAADEDVLTILMCWELRAAGYPECWRQVLGLDDGDMALVFGCALERDPSSLYSGAALSQVFTQWYEDDLRVDSADHTALEQLDTAFEIHGGCAGEAPLKASDIEKLSLLPDGVSYLRGMGESILKTPDFAGVDDPINQAHLFQIIYDSKVTMSGGVPFRDSSLARKIFP